MDVCVTPDQLGTVLGVWAHPDDEAFLMAGLAARLTDAGGHVAYVTATRGELGTSDPSRWPPDRLGRRREMELRASLAVVGVTDHRFLDHVDGSLPDVPFRRGVDQVAEVIDRVRPDTVVTFGPDGLTGHGDHQAVSRWATQACREVGRRIRLLYACTKEDFEPRWRHVNARANAFAEGHPVGTPSDRIVLDLELTDEELDRKLVAMAAQSSQLHPLITLLGEDTCRQWWASESFALAAHPPAPRRRVIVLPEAATAPATAVSV